MRTPTARSIAAAVILFILFLLPLVVGSVPDVEEKWSAILSTHIAAQSDLARIPLWTHLLGLGVPQPLIPSLITHPLAPVFRFLRPDHATLVLICTHYCLVLTLMIASMVRWEWHSWAIFTTLATFFFCAPSINYHYTDDWPTTSLTWTTMWAVVLLLCWLVDRKSRVPPWVVACWLGMSGFVWISCSNPRALVHCSPILIGILMSEPAQTRLQIKWLGLACVIAVAGGAFTVVHEYGQYAMFDASLPTPNAPWQPAAGSLVADLVARPFDALATWGSKYGEHLGGARKVFFGGVFFILAVVGAVRGIRNPGRARGFGVAFFLSAAALLVPMERLGSLGHLLLTSTSFFREPLIVAGILLAGQLLSDLLIGSVKARRKGFRCGYWALRALCGVQICALALHAWPFWSTCLRNQNLGSIWFSDNPFVKALDGAGVRRGDRLYLSPGFEHHIQRWREGLFPNVLAYHGFRVISGRVKGIYLDDLSPASLAMYGDVHSQASLTRSRDFLDLFGIRYVIALESEAVAPHLSPRSAILPEVILYENPSSGREVLELRNSSARPERLPVAAGCEHDRFLCSDFSALRALTVADASLSLSRPGPASIEIRTAASAGERYLAVMELYRKGWTARAFDEQGRDAGVCVVEPLFGSLVGLTLPPQTAKVRLEFKPRLLSFLADISAVFRWATLTLAALSGAVVWCRWPIDR